MDSTTKQIAFIATKIWITALTVNTALGLYVVSDSVKMPVGDLAVKGLIYGAVFSFPIFLVVWLMLYLMIKGMFSAGNIFLILLVAAGLLTLGSFYLFSEYMQLSASLNIPLGGSALAASALGILPQFNPIRKACFQRDHPGHFRRRDKVEA
ncbi:MAG: hypothetical protein V4722_00460 [Bacteroidota bacterium]